MTTTPPPPDPCPAFVAELDRVLDRDLPLAEVDRAHPAECAECRAQLAAVEALSNGLQWMPAPRPSPDLGERIVRSALRDRRRRRAVRWAGVGTSAVVAAAVLLAVGPLLGPWNAVEPGREIVSTGPTEPLPTTPEILPAPRVVARHPPERLTDRVSEAGSALASITRKATNSALTPTRTFLSSTERVAFAPADLPAGVEPAADSLAGIPQAARSGIEPMTSGARRAVNLFLRDTGLEPPKPKS